MALGGKWREVNEHYSPRLPLTGKLANRADATTDLTDEVGIGARQFRVSYISYFLPSTRRFAATSSAFCFAKSTFPLRGRLFICANNSYKTKLGRILSVLKPSPSHWRVPPPPRWEAIRMCEQHPHRVILERSEGSRWGTARGEETVLSKASPKGEAGKSVGRNDRFD